MTKLFLPEVFFVFRTEEVLGAMASSITYDTCKFNPPPSSEFVCAVCHCVLHEPRMCVCRHIFCKVCIETWLNRSSTCPSCRSHATLRQLQVAPPLVVNVLNGLTMDCEYKEKGCDITISMEKFPSHVTSCEYRVRVLLAVYVLRLARFVITRRKVMPPSLAHGNVSFTHHIL